LKGDYVLFKGKAALIPSRTGKSAASGTERNIAKHNGAEWSESKDIVFAHAVATLWILVATGEAKRIPIAAAFYGCSPSPRRCNFFPKRSGA
jgi:hypothetical protein